MFVFYRPIRANPDKTTLTQKLKKVDAYGLLLFTGGLTSVLVGLMWAGGPTHAWKSASVIVPIILGVLGILGAVVWDARWSQRPALPWWLLREFRTFSALTLVIFMTSIAFFPMLAYIPQGLFLLLTSDSIEVGKLALPSTLGQGICLILGTFLVHKLGFLKLQLILLLGLQTVFFASAIGVFDPFKKWQFIFLPAISMSVYGWQGLINITLLSLNLPHPVLGTAIALNSSMRTAGGALGGAVFNAIFQGVYHKGIMRHASHILAEAHIPADIQSKLVAACLEKDFTALAQLTADKPTVLISLIGGIQSASGHALRMLFVAATVSCFTALVAACFVSDKVGRTADSRTDTESADQKL